VSVYRYGPPWLHFEPLPLPTFDFNADPDLDPAFHSTANLDPVSQNNADPKIAACRLKITSENPEKYMILRGQSKNLRIWKLSSKGICGICTVVHFYGTTRQFLVLFSVNLKKDCRIVCIGDNSVKISSTESGICESNFGFKVGCSSFCLLGF
jgi:hypothetical protein